jgi:glycosyltransferase involved in cell wall biosynthesis
MVRDASYASQPRTQQTHDGGTRRRVFLFFGAISAYKGITDFLSALVKMPSGSVPLVRIVGQVRDAELRSALLSAENDQVVVIPERVTDEQLDDELMNADVVVLPFRDITTSGSVIMAMSYGKPVIIPDLAALRDIPDNACMRFERAGNAEGDDTGDPRSVESLTSVLQLANEATDELLQKLGENAAVYASRHSWADAAKRHARVYRELVPRQARSRLGVVQ